MNEDKIKDYFNIDYYLSILENKKTICLKDFKDNEDGIIIRHDVDYSIEFAFKLSRYEKEKNINATYFILLTSDFYNVFSNSSKKQILTMIEDGFEIGLHFDPTVYSNQDECSLLQYLKKEIKMFDDYFKYKIKSYSMHNPSITGTYVKNNEMNDAYDRLIFNQDVYISDSSYNYRGKNPEEFLEKSNKLMLQYLTHPLHFFGDNNTYNTQLKIIVKSYYNKMDIAMLNANRHKKTKIEMIFND